MGTEVLQKMLLKIVFVNFFMCIGTLYVIVTHVEEMW